MGFALCPGKVADPGVVDDAEVGGDSLDPPDEVRDELDEEERVRFPEGVPSRHAVPPRADVVDRRDGEAPLR